MLTALRDGLAEFLDAIRVKPVSGSDRLQLARAHFGMKSFARKDYRQFFKALSTATASRDLVLGVEKGWLEKTGDKVRAQYRFGS